MAGMLQIICFVMLGALLCYAAVSDAQRRIIPNWLTLTIAALAVPYWLGTGLELWPDIALPLCLAAGAFVIFAGLFDFGLLGRGDVNLLAALAPWLPDGRFLDLVVIISLAGSQRTHSLVVCP